MLVTSYYQKCFSKDFKTLGASLTVQTVKNLPAMLGDPWVRKNPWRKAWQPTPVFLPGEPHKQGSLEGYSPWGCKEVIEQAHTL